MELTLQTTIEPVGPAAAIMLTREQADELSSAKTPPVVVTIGERSARLRITRMRGAICIGLSLAARALLGVEIGEEVTVVIRLDEAEREVTLPEELAEALHADPEARAAFEALSYTRRKEIAASLTQAKREATRTRRLAKALEGLRSVR